MLAARRWRPYIGASTQTSSPAPHLKDQLQLTVGNNYTLERELDGGGMSRVFVAEEIHSAGLRQVIPD
jgi:hypothetical protein